MYTVLWCEQVLTLSEGVQRQAGLPGLDGEQPLPLEVEQVLLLDLLDLQELLLEGQLLGGHLLLWAHTHTHTISTQKYRSIKASANIPVRSS